MSDKWLDRGKDADPMLISPKMLELAHAHAQEFKQRAEVVESAAKHLIAIIDRQELSGLITRDLIRAKDELRLLVNRQANKQGNQRANRD